VGCGFQHDTAFWNISKSSYKHACDRKLRVRLATHCNTLQHTATHCESVLQHTATHCNTLQHTATHCNTLQHTATHYNTLQQTANNTLQQTATLWHRESVLQHVHRRVCVFMCTYTYTHKCIDKYTSIYTYEYIFSLSCAYLSIYVSINIHMRLLSYIKIVMPHNSKCRELWLVRIHICIYQHTYM